MGFAVFIEPDPPFTKLDSLVRLARSVGPLVEVHVATHRRDILRRLVDAAAGHANLNLDLPLRATRRLSQYADLRGAGYLDARHDGGALRLWPHQVWLDSFLGPTPTLGEVTSQPEHNGAPRFGVIGTDHHACIQAWLDAATGERVRVAILRTPSAHLDVLIEAAEEHSIEITAEVAIDDAVWAVVGSGAGAVVLGFRWPVLSLSRQRLSPACHDSVSRPRHFKPDVRISRIRLTARVSSHRGYGSVSDGRCFRSRP
ncbi:MAG: hypothetical protein AAGF12_26520, partial [Myxococcota bacterium]